jgi:hypothetical protein
VVGGRPAVGCTSEPLAGTFAIAGDRPSWYPDSFAIQATAHPAFMPHEVAGSSRPRPPNPATPGSESPGRGGNPRLSSLSPQAPRPACHAGGRGFESRRSRLRSTCKSNDRVASIGAIGATERDRLLPELCVGRVVLTKYLQNPMLLGHRPLDAQRETGHAPTGDSMVSAWRGRGRRGRRACPHRVGVRSSCRRGRGFPRACHRRDQRTGGHR